MLLVTLITLTPSAIQAAAFTPGNIVVYRTSSGVALSPAATAAFLDEYTTSGTYVQTITLPTTVASSGNRAMTCAGSSTSEGQINLSTDGAYISCVGYNAAVGTLTVGTSANNGGGSDVNRVIGRVDASGTVDSSTAIAGVSGGAYTGGAIRDSFISGSSIYSVGSVNPFCAYSTFGGSTATTVTGAGNSRCVGVFGGDVYYTTSTTFNKLSGLPTSTATIIQLLGATAGQAPANASDFVMLDVGASGSINTCYIVDGASLKKYSVSGTTLTAKGSATITGSGSTFSGLAAKVTGSSVTFYISSAAKIETITDSSGVGGTFSGTATAITLTGNPVTLGTTAAFRGIAFTPTSTVVIDNTGTPAVGSITTAANDVPVFGFQLTPTSSADFTALKLTTAGTATSSDLNSFRVVYDANANGIFDGGDSVVSGSGLSLANPINFTITGQTGFSGARRYLVIANVAGGATVGHTFTGSIAAPADVTSSISVSGTAAGSQQTIAAAAFDLTMTAVASSESATISSITNDATITTTSQGAQVWQVTFANPAGNAGVANISAISFTQGANNGVTVWSNMIQAAELFIGTTPLAAGTISGTSIAFSGLSLNVPQSGSQTLSLRISLKSTAGALTDNAGLQFALAAADVAVSGNGVVSASINSDQSQNLISVVATKLAFTSVPTYVVTNANFSVTVQAQDANGNRDLDGSPSATLAINTGVGTLGGITTLGITSGSRTYSVFLDTTGIFTLQVSDDSAILTTAISSPLTARIAPTLTEVIMPQYIPGITNGSTNTKRLPFAYCVTISNLTANATYRYDNQCVGVNDTATASGAGNIIFASASGNFVETSNPGLSTTGGYGTFVTDANGTYTGWFVTEPTGNAKFSTNGTQTFMRIVLNDGAGGTSVNTRLTTPDYASVLGFGPDSTSGTAIHGSSSASAKNFVVLYDNVAGTGRPLAATFVEDDGFAENTGGSFASFYSTTVDGIAGAWGTIIPNGNANGVQRIEQRSLAGGGIISSNTDSDGIWPSTANTVNPSGADTTPIVITSSDAPLASAAASTPVVTGIQITGGNVLIDFTALTTDTAGSFSVVGTTDLLNAMAPVSASMSTLSPGVFRATIAVTSTTNAFYRIKH